MYAFQNWGKASSRTIYFRGAQGSEVSYILEVFVVMCPQLKRIRFLVALSPRFYPLTTSVLYLCFAILSASRCI